MRERARFGRHYHNTALGTKPRRPNKAKPRPMKVAHQSSLMPPPEGLSVGESSGSLRREPKLFIVGTRCSLHVKTRLVYIALDSRAVRSFRPRYSCRAGMPTAATSRGDLL